MKSMLPSIAAGAVAMLIRMATDDIRLAAVSGMAAGFLVGIIILIEDGARP